MRVTHIYDVREDLLSLYTVDKPFLSMGAFGCVMRATRTTPEGESIALKVQYSDGRNGVDAEREAEFARRAAKLVNDPFGLQVYELFRIPLDAISSQEVDLLFHEECEHLREQIK